MTPLLLLVSLSASPAEQCVSASYLAQRLRDDRKWLAASRALLSCAQESCPKLVRDDCLEWRGELEELTPSLLVVVQADGADAPDAQVELDGAPLQLSGTAVPVDPGPHVLVARRGARTVTARVLALEREKGRKLVLALEPEPAPAALAPPPGAVTPPVAAASPPTAVAAPSRSARLPLMPALVAGALGVAGLVTFAGLGIDARLKLGRLAAQPCAETSTCDTEPLRPQLLAADLALGLGAALLIGAVVWGLVWYLGG